MILDKLGEMALGSRLRMLSELVTKDAERLYELYGVDLKPKWFPVFYFLSQDKAEKSITEIAKAINHSHPSVIKIVREMSKHGLVSEEKDKSDGRKNNIVLTQKGIEVVNQIQDQYLDVDSAIKELLSQTQHNIWQAIQETEYLLNQKSLYSRVIAQKKKRESAQVQIIEYTPDYQYDFKRLNEEWITTYFKMEEADRRALDHPEEYILDKGGKILLAVENEIVLGVCALLKTEEDTYDFELAKMAVSPEARGKGIGYLLGKAIIGKAILLGAKKIYLESNTILEPAISLYKKLGFTKIAGRPTPYERSNIQMECRLG